jgi:hypothetical protein
MGVGALRDPEAPSANFDGPVGAPTSHSLCNEIEKVRSSITFKERHKTKIQNKRCSNSVSMFQVNSATDAQFNRAIGPRLLIRSDSLPENGKLAN